jgi:23S rRNA (uracil1939-C5)-methyltransferase
MKRQMGSKAQGKSKGEGRLKDKGKVKGKDKSTVHGKDHQGRMREGLDGGRIAGGLAAGAKARAGAGAALDVPVRVGESYTAEVIGIGHEGQGVGRVDGFTLFIHGALPGERVRAKVVHVKKQYGFAELVEVVDASADRREAPCAIYESCGGCQLQHLDYAAQLRWKRQLVVDQLERIGKLKVAGDVSDALMDTIPFAQEAVVVHPTLGMPDPWRYRNKVQVPIGEREGGLVSGFYAQGTHTIIDMDTCLIQQEQGDDVVGKVKRIAQGLGIRAYDEATHTGLLRHVVVRVGYRTGEVMVVLVTNGSRIPFAQELIDSIREDVPSVTSICQNINTRQTNVIFGDQTDVLWGRDVIYDLIGDIKFAISARSFFQVNPTQTEVLYGKALDYAGLTGEETVIDAYCGIGTISLFLARQAKKVYGVEIVPEAIEDARANAALNGIGNVDFAVGKAEELIPAWREQGIVADVIVVDPPRKGCDAALLATIAAMRPRRVVYVSCNPATLARDLAILEDGGYRTVEVQPVDMFPHTVHVESVALLDYRDNV